MTELEPITPRDAVDWYITDREDELRYSTKRNLQNGLDNFLEWTDVRGLDNMNAVTGRELRRWKTWRKDRDGVRKITLNSNLAVLQRFLKWCVDIEAVEKDIPD